MHVLKKDLPFAKTGDKIIFDRDNLSCYVEVPHTRDIFIGYVDSLIEKGWIGEVKQTKCRLKDVCDCDMKKYKLKDLLDPYLTIFSGGCSVLYLIIPISDEEGVPIFIKKTKGN